MNAPVVFAFAGVGVAATFLAVVWLALTAGVWVWNRVQQNQPVPYYPADGLQRLAAALEETPLFDQVLEEADWRQWADELGDVPHE